MSKIIVTAQKRDANRRNAQHSTGPRTPDGKARSSRNATRHGLLSLEATLPNENHTAFEADLQAFLHDLQPANILEARLVERLASLDHKIRRAARLQSGILASDYQEVLDTEAEYDHFHPPPGSDPYDEETWRLAKSYARSAKDFDNLSRTEARLLRDFRRTLQDLLAVRRLRENISDQTNPNSGKPLPINHLPPSLPSPPQCPEPPLATPYSSPMRTADQVPDQVNVERLIQPGKARLGSRGPVLDFQTPSAAPGYSVITSRSRILSR